MSTVGNNIPEKTIERLSEYRRTLLACHKQGITHIFSHVLAGMHGITAVQVRRDLMLIGFSSDTKKGYDVKVLIEFINGILDSECVMNVAVIGMGNLGQAITKYFNGKGLKLRIVTAGRADHQRRNQGSVEFHLGAAQLPAGHRRRKLRHNHHLGEGGLLRQGVRREQRQKLGLRPAATLINESIQRVK